MKLAIAPSAPTLLISDTGRVLRMASSRRNRGRWQTYPEIEVKARPIGAGYLAICSKEQGVKRTLYVHRLVAEAFLGKPGDATDVNHIDGDKTNNNLANLEWTTHSKNLQHAVRAGLAGRVALTPADVRQIRALITEGCKRSEIAKRFGVSLSAVAHIHSGHSWAWLD